MKRRSHGIVMFVYNVGNCHIGLKPRSHYVIVSFTMLGLSYKCEA